MSNEVDVEHGTLEVFFRDGLTAREQELARASAIAIATNAARSATMQEGSGAPEDAPATLSGLTKYDTAIQPAEFVLAVPPPFDFGWAWHDGQEPKQVITDQNTGRLVLYGQLNGGDATYSQVHAGFGIFLRTDRSVRPSGAAKKRAAVRWDTQAAGAYTHATSEGGIEYTVLENGVFHGVEARSKLWRKRVSIDEEEGFTGPMTYYWDPRTLDFTMEPGRDYTFNVGFWITCDRSFGAFGAALCQGLLDGAVEAISVTGL